MFDRIQWLPDWSFGQRVTMYVIFTGALALFVIGTVLPAGN